MAQSFIVTVERGKTRWVLHCPELSIVSQCRSLSEIEDEMVPIISDVAEIDENEIVLEISYQLPDDVLLHVEEAKVLEAEALEKQQRAAREKVAAIKALASKGITQRDIGRIMGLSHQRIAQLARG